MDNQFDEIYIENAGLVLLAPYLHVLFERIELTNENNFFGIEDQEKATLLTQYLLMDNPPLDDDRLALNKVLTGLSIAHVMESELTLSKSDKALIHGLLVSVISHWTVIGDSSVEGFRASWLWRKGKLAHKENNWELRVEQRSYDLLLDRLPYSISPIKFSWMEKPLIVIWR
uniref:contractile injection system tape measure protein n=1 Tax=Roseivirga sp. TaxID=1964215 RepID=UPI0040480476